ncbi:MAG TPA: hypothetical protein VGM87_25135 [Roseomonas sp.]|jgi:hypothetical protein
MSGTEAPPAWTLEHRRDDGSFVVTLGGHPYQVLPGDPLFPAVAAEAEGVDLPPEAPPIAFPVPPPTLTARQLRLWLLSRGIPLAAVDAAIGGLPEPRRAMAQVDWQYATLFERANPLIDQLGAALGLSPAEIDQAFTEAWSLWP